MSSGKSELRQRFDRYRHSLDVATFENLSKLIVKRLIALPEVRGADVVHAYWPMIERREVDTRPFIHWLKEQGKEIVLPVVLNFQSTSNETGRLGHVRYPGEEGLRLNRWGIAEPAEHHPVSPQRINVVVAPALGAGRNGHRIGFGFGYYDEFLAELTVPVIAVVYDSCLLDDVPFEEHDIPVDVIVTEREVVRPMFNNPRDVTQTRSSRI